jgi:three-Cys-motif partner protein
LITKQLLSFLSDDFTVTAVETWFKVKVQVVQGYLQAFAAQVVAKADEIVFIDLFAGSGFYSSGFEKQLIPMPTLHALGSDPPFTKYIFSEPNDETAEALKVRVNRYFRGRNVVIFEDRQEGLLDKLRSCVPPSNKSYKVAALCLIAPFSIDFSFNLVERLSSFKDL